MYHTPPKTNECHLNIDGWKMIYPFGPSFRWRSLIFREYSRSILAGKIPFKIPLKNSTNKNALCKKTYRFYTPVIQHSWLENGPFD